VTTENVTVLFTDMVGSTELAASLSAEAADDVRRGHFSILRQALAEAGGTEVKNLGDGLMVVFSSAAAALSCGVAMQQGIERDNRNREQAVGLRVGLSIGEVSREDDDYFGEPVIEAARLCARCERGQVLAADLVRGMAGRRSHHEYRSLGKLELKGLPDPLETVEVLWEPVESAGAAVGMPLPGRLALRPALGVVGREPELATMSDAFKRVVSGEGREVLLVSGEAGLGKSTLVAEASRAAFDAGACVLFGHCEEDLATPYQLFAEALGHYVTHAREDQLAAHVSAHGSELARLVPALASRLPDLPPSKATDPETERYLLFAAVVGLLSEASQDQPVVLVLDDLQWADKASLLLLRHLTASDVPMRVLVVGTYRDTELSQTHPFLDALAALHRQHAVSQIELSGLDDTGVLAFLEAAAGHTLEDAGVDLAHAVYRETDGNPFFVTEVLRHLSETGAIYQDDAGRWTARDSLDEMALPESVRVVIGARVGRLRPDAGRVLSVAAVIGRDFDLDLLARATDTSEDDLLDILDAAAAAALVRELADAPGRYNFAHALIQHTLYEDLGPTRRARAHRRVGEALEALCGERPGSRVGELARHWSSATRPSDLAKAIDYSRQAGDAALAALAPADALHHYSQAIDLYPEITDPDPTLGLDLAIGLGTAQSLTGDPAFRATLIDAAHRATSLGDTDRLVAAALANNRGFISAVGTIDVDKVEILEMALDALGPDEPERALVLATLCAELGHGTPLERRVALADEAVAVAESSGDDAIFVRVSGLLHISLQVPSLHERLLAQTADALERAERLGDPVLVVSAAAARLEACAQAGDVEEMDRCLALAGPLVERVAHPTQRWLHTYQRCLRALIAGDTDRAEQFASEALEIGTDGGQPDAATIFGAQFMGVSHQRGTLPELVPLIEAELEANPGLPVLKPTLASALTRAGRTDEGRRLLEDAAAAGFDLPMDQLWLTGMVTYGWVAAECQDPDIAVQLLERLAPWADRFCTAGGTTPNGPVSATLGRLATALGRFDEADAYFTQAAAMCERMGARFYAAEANLAWGEMCVERNAPTDIGRARELLTEARTAAAANGYPAVERRAADALAGLVSG